MNSIDKSIKMNFKMAENEIGILCVVSGATSLCLLSVISIFIMPVLLIASVIFVVKLYKKLFYTSLYGETAAFYQSLPLTTEEMTVSRIFTAGTGNLLCAAVTILCMAAAAAAGPFEIDFTDFAASLVSSVTGENVGSGVGGVGKEVFSVPFLVPMVFLAEAAGVYRQSAFILMAVVIYNSFPQRKRTEWTKILAIACGAALNGVMENFGSLLRLMGASSTALWAPLLCMAADGLLTVLFYRITVRKLEAGYALNGQGA